MGKKGKVSLNEEEEVELESYHFVTIMVKRWI